LTHHNTQGSGRSKHELDALTPRVKIRGPPRYVAFRSRAVASLKPTATPKRAAGFRCRLRTEERDRQVVDRIIENSQRRFPFGSQRGPTGGLAPGPL